MILLGTFAAIALILALIGIYAVLSYIVQQRSREIAVRLAIGARPSGIFAIVAARGMALTGIGIAVGLAATVTGVGLLQTLLFGVTGRDSWTLACVTMMLTMGAIAACIAPALRASRIDPIEALRNE